MTLREMAQWQLKAHLHSQCSGLVKIWFTPKKNNELIFIQCGYRMCHILKYPSATFLPVLMKTAVILEILFFLKTNLAFMVYF